ncbi:MAG: UvrD-helicase domain-containing protein [Anaerolineales bacterium]
MKLLDELNPQQRLAVTAPPGPVLVLAGPGSGKTRVLTHRIVYQVTELGIPPQQIVAVTFTNRAAREMRTRVEIMLGDDSAHASATNHLTMGTFHAFAARMIRREADSLPLTREFVIFDDSDQLALVRGILKDLNIDPKQFSPRRIHSAISTAKNELIDSDVFPSSSYFNEIVKRVYELYGRQLLASNALDFDDLLLYAVRLLRESDPVRDAYRRRYQHILVDEFQDTNTAQYILLKLLTSENPDIFVVGDPDQSIYRWRGADYRNVIRFQEDYPGAETILLEKNYRSTQNILDLAMSVIDRHPGRQRKKLYSDRGSGELILFHEAYDELDEADYVLEIIDGLKADGEVEPSDCAVMYRTNVQSRVIEEAFLRAGQPYRLVGAQRFYGRREVKDVIAYLRLIHNPDDQVSLLRVLNTPPRGIGNKTVSTLLQVAEDFGHSPGTVLLDLAKGPSPNYSEQLSRRALAALSGFGELLDRWREGRAEELGDLINSVLVDIGYQTYIDDGTEEGEDRWANVMELHSLAAEFSKLGLSIFLEHVALISDQDTLTEAQNAPTLLTLHAAKGLEFPNVIIVGLDDGLIPHQRSFDEPEAMHEERRLLYVGITRAKDRLFLLRAFRRRIFGTSSVAEPSRYLEDFPPALIDGDVSGIFTREQTTFRKQTTWDWQPHAEEIEPQFGVGTRVKHATFGEGIVMSSKMDQNDEEVTIAFKEYGIKILVTSLAGLETLDD